MPKIKNTIKIALTILIPLFFIIFLVGGCSFKYMDWQYYKFLCLCNTQAKNNILNTEIDNTIKIKDMESINYSRVNITNRITKISFQNIHKKSRVVYYEQERYFYRNYGIFLQGDEGRGFYLKYNDLLDCFPQARYLDKEYNNYAK